MNHAWARFPGECGPARILADPPPSAALAGHDDLPQAFGPGNGVRTVPYDLLATCLDVRAGPAAGIPVRWRAAGYAEPGRPGPGPVWCWLARSGLVGAG